jgi:hypothetical protein
MMHQTLIRTSYITVTLPQFDGKKGEATKFVTRFIRLANGKPKIPRGRMGFLINGLPQQRSINAF